MFKGPLHIVFMCYCASLVWIFVNLLIPSNVVICPFRLVTHLPCVACGTTTALMLLIKGHILEALLHNLNIIFIVPCIVLYTLSLLCDTFCGTAHTQNLYNKVNVVFKRKLYLYSFFAFEIVVWALHFYVKLT